MHPSIFEYVQSHTQQALMDEAVYEPEPTKAFSVRIPERYVNLLDKIADAINVSRSQLVSEIVCNGADEALAGYASVFQDPADAAKHMRDLSGFGAPFSQEATLEEAEEVQRQLEDDFAAHEAEQAKRN